MKVQKQVIGRLEKCYSLSRLTWQGKECLLAASEISAPCRLFDLDGRLLDTVWTQPGGVMTMAPVPRRDGVFLATQRFYSPNDSKQAGLAAASYTDGGWQVTEVCPLPFLHRFGVLSRGGVDYLIACALKSGHEHEDDWRFPGKVFAGVLPDDPVHTPPKLEVIGEGLGHNHGFTLFPQDGYYAAVISSDLGVSLYRPPERAGAPWQIEPLLHTPASDAVLIDLDADGSPELLTLEPFHGDRLCIYHLREGVYEKVYEHPEKLPFLHAIDCGIIDGRPVALAGNREGKRELLLFYYDRAQANYRYEVIDSGAGPANCLLLTRGGHSSILAANRETDEIAIYDVGF